MSAAGGAAAGSRGVLAPSASARPHHRLPPVQGERKTPWGSEEGVLGAGRRSKAAHSGSRYQGGMVCFILFEATHKEERNRIASRLPHAARGTCSSPASLRSSSTRMDLSRRLQPPALAPCPRGSAPWHRGATSPLPCSNPAHSPSPCTVIFPFPPGQAPPATACLPPAASTPPLPPPPSIIFSFTPQKAILR